MTNLLSLDDEGLIREARNGNVGALDALLRRFKRMVKAKCAAYYITGGDRDDLIQEGMIGLFKAIRDYDPARNRSFNAFADMCVSRQIMTAVKASARQKHIPLNTSLSFDAQLYGDYPGQTVMDTLISGSGDNPETLLIGRETVNDINSLLKKQLSEMEFEVLMLHLQGCCNADIAHAVDKNIKAVDNALQRVRRKIGEMTSNAQQTTELSRV